MIMYIQKERAGTSMILGIEIINFDVFDDDKCGMLIDDSIAASGGDKASDALRLRNLNALIGRNQTGKSSFIRAMSFVKRCIIHDVAHASTLDGRPGFSKMIIDKTAPAGFKIFFRLKDKNTGKTKFLQYELFIEAGRFGSPKVKEEKITASRRVDGKIVKQDILDLKYGKGTVCFDDNCIDTSIEGDKQTALSVYGKIGTYKDICDLYHEIDRWFFCEFSSEEVSSYYADGNAPGGHKHLNSTGSNMTNVLEYMRQTDPEGYEKTIASIRDRIPAMKKKKTLPSNLEGSHDKLFLYLLLLSDRDPHSTIFIETPDRDLYHDMVDVLADEMREFSIKNPYSQIVFSTHNPYIVESMSPREIWVFSRDFGSEKDDGVKIKCAGSDPVVNALFDEGVGMGAIWYGGHLDEPGEEAAEEAEEDGDR